VDYRPPEGLEEELEPAIAGSSVKICAQAVTVGEVGDGREKGK
jgi:hypothetical protein